MELPLRVSHFRLQKILDWRAVDEKLTEIVSGFLHVVVEREGAVRYALTGGPHDVVICMLSG